MKRVYKAADIQFFEHGFAITLDGKQLPTPAKAAFALPSEPLARAIADEWAAQGDTVKPQTMPLTKLASTAIDHVRLKLEPVANETLRYAESDLLCYRATEPDDLIVRQHRVWQPLLDWAATALDAPLNIVSGMMPVAQPAASIEALARRVRALDHFRLTGLADLTAATGSLIVALAVLERHLSGAAAADAALLDNEYQIEHWGEDREEAQRLSRLRADIEAASRFVELLH